MQSRFQRALGVAVVMALASPVPAMAQETFLRCSSMIISFNPASQAIVEYDIDGNRLGSLCTLPESFTTTRRALRTRDRTTFTYSDLICTVLESEISVRYTINRRHEYSTNENRDDFRLARHQNPPEILNGLRIDRRSGDFYFHRQNASPLRGQCEAIERPTPRPNRF
jgi:hypothetical protein